MSVFIATISEQFPCHGNSFSVKAFSSCEKAKMFYRDTVDVKPLPDYKLFLTFGDGKQGVFDCKPYRQYEFMADVWADDVFDKVGVDHGTVMWPGGEDLCPDDLYDNCVRV